MYTLSIPAHRFVFDTEETFAYKKSALRTEKETTRGETFESLALTLELNIEALKSSLATLTEMKESNIRQLEYLKKDLQYLQKNYTVVKKGKKDRAK